MRKKVLSVLLVLAMVLSLGAVSFAAEPSVVKAYADLDLGDMTGKTVILHSNDVHGAIAGYAYMAQLKADYKAAGAEVILVDAGDFSQGTTYVSTSSGADAITMMNAVGYDFATLGNHEFDYGYETLAANLKKATFKVLCADVLDSTGKTIYDANAVVEKGGVKIGFFGLETPEAQTKANPALIKGLTFLSKDSTTTVMEAAQNQVDELSKKADLVIGIVHLGVDDESAPYRSYDLTKAVKEYDFIIDGHSHTVMTAGLSGEKVQSTGTQFANIGVIVIDNASKSIEDNYLVGFDAWTVDTATKTVTYPETVKYDATVAAAAGKIITRVLTEYGKVFAKSLVTLNGAKAPNGNRDSETNNGDIITDAMVYAASKNGGLTVDADHVVAITNGGGIRAAINPGDVSKNDVNTVLPFGNTVYTVYITGAELLEALEASTYCTPDSVGGFPQVSGIDYTVNTAVKYNANAETYPGSTYYGPASIKRVTINNINGEAFSLTDTYAVVTNDFCAGGGDTYYAFAAAEVGFDTGIPMDEALMDYIVNELKGVIGEEYAQPQDRIGVHPFTDVVAGSWYEQYVADLYTNGVVAGTSTVTNTYTPAGTLTWGQALKLLLVANGDLAAADATGEAWLTNTLACATKLGLVDATVDGTKAISRLDFCQVAAKLFKIAESKDTSVFADCTDGYVMALYEEGVINGVATTGSKMFAPEKTLTRAEISKIIYLITALDDAA